MASAALKDSDSLLDHYLPALDFVELRQLLKSPVRLMREVEEGEEQALAEAEGQAFLIFLVYSQIRLENRSLYSS